MGSAAAPVERPPLRDLQASKNVSVQWGQEHGGRLWEAAAQNRGSAARLAWPPPELAQRLLEVLEDRGAIFAPSCC